MNRYLFACAALVLQVSSPLQAENFNVTADRQIITATSSSTFQNVVLNYPFEGSTHPIRIIYNPEKKPLWASTWSAPKYNELTVFSDLPYALAAHVETVLVRTRRSGEKPTFYLTGYDALRHGAPSNPSISQKRSTIPLPMPSPRKFLALLNLSIRSSITIWTASTARSGFCTIPKAAPFLLPKNTISTLTANINIPLIGTINLGFFALYPVDSRLISHLSRLANASYREWYFNFDVSNALLETYEIDSWNYTETFYLDTKFEYAENFH